MSHSAEIEIRETEEELLGRAQDAVSRCNWVVGECAAKWTKKYARGRTDHDFANLVGLSPDQVYQRRRVWETFGDVFENYPALRWSHFYVALNWDDAPECLQWGEENQATVAEMKAWRRAMRGDEASDEPEAPPWTDAAGVSFLPDAPSPVRDPQSFAPGRGGAVRAGGPNGDSSATVAGFARESESTGGEDAEPGEVSAEPPRPRTERLEISAEQLFARMTATLERMTKAITPELERKYRRLPAKVRERFETALEEFRARVTELA